MMTNNNNNNNNNDDDNDEDDGEDKNDTARASLDLFLPPHCTHNIHVQTMCNTSGTCHPQHDVNHMMQRDSLWSCLI